MQDADKKEVTRDSDCSDERLDRRRFLGSSVSAATQLLAAAAAVPLAARGAMAVGQDDRIVAQEPFGRLERVGDGVWAMISTPLEARTTLCNGGIIAGGDVVVMIEGFGSVEGAQWMAAKALELTGNRPTHVVVTHYHGDHTNGLAGYLNDSGNPEVIHTAKTYELLEASLANADRGGAQSPLDAIDPQRGRMADRGEISTLTLGDQQLQVRAVSGHTPSDLTVHVEEQRVVFCGDLAWNAMFPNYRDALPSELAESCRRELRDEDAVYVPGHGDLATHAEMQRFIALIDSVGEAATSAHGRGLSATDGAAEYEVPESLGEWFMFSPRYHEVAFEAWYRELDGAEVVDDAI